jgi:nicotinamide-nucleotide amidase
VTRPRAAAPRSAELRRLAQECGRALTHAGRLLVCAESCTGGLIAATCTSIPGSSDWFEGSFVTYQARTKRRVLGVAASTLQQHGVVSESTAREMAIGALERSEADIAVGVTGVAGPAGGDIDHPVGTVWFAWASRTDRAIVVRQTAHRVFPGNREQVRRAAVAAALEGVAAIVSHDPIA